MKVICISGKAMHGKDTAANYMKRKLTFSGSKVLIIHYADLLKYICTSVFSWNGVKDEKGRKLLQHVGTDVVREYNPNYWVDFVISILEMFGGEWDYVLIPDCRFPNEIETLKESLPDVYSLRIVRENFVSRLTKEQQQHASETALDEYDFDYIIHNKDMGDFYKNIGDFINDLNGGDSYENH